MRRNEKDDNGDENTPPGAGVVESTGCNSGQGGHAGDNLGVMEVPRQAAPQPKDGKMMNQKIYIEMTMSMRSPRTNSSEKWKRRSRKYHKSRN